MTDFSSYPMVAFSWGDPNVDLENPRFVISVQWTWPTGVWSHFSIVRSTRSPATRREEGQVMMECVGTDWDSLSDYGNTGLPYEGLPVYRDPQPPPGEWVYYTAFVLNENRVWKQVGYAYEICIEDYDWALRLPELLPGVSIGDMSRTASPAQQDNDVVQFLQPPGAILDKVVTMAESAQHFWDPIKVPPQMLPYLVESLGYQYDPALGIAQERQVIDALMKGRQGSLEFIRNFTQGALGSLVFAEISNNLMLDVNDSSFESGTLVGTNWSPSTSADMELRKYEDEPTIPVTLHPNVLVTHYAHLKKAGTYYVGGNPIDAVKRGIPIVGWTRARMGIHARKPTSASPNVTMDLGLNLHDQQGVFLATARILTRQNVSESTNPTQWRWFGNPGTKTVGIAHISPGNILQAAQAEPASGWLPVSSACTLAYSAGVLTATSTVVGTSRVILGTRAPVTVGKTYACYFEFKSTGTPTVSVSAYTSGGTGLGVVACVSDGPALDDSTWTRYRCTFVVTDPTTANLSPLIGITNAAVGSTFQVRRVGIWEGIGGEWSPPGLPIAVDGGIPPVQGAAYAVPWVIVSNPCYVDLLVVDDG